MRIMIRQLAPGMVQQMQSVCTDCNGEGNLSINTHILKKWIMSNCKPKRQFLKPLMCVCLGEVINEKDRCKKCEGHKVCKETKLLEVHVDKGMKHGQKITFSGEADQAPGVEPGDIVLVLQEKEHEVTHLDVPLHNSSVTSDHD